MLRFEYQEAETKRKAAEDEAARRASFEETFNAAIGDKKFSNDLMRETVFEKVYGMCGKTSGLGAKEAIETVTKDVDGVWLNPQKDVHRMPSAGQLDEKQQAIADSKQALANLLFGGKD